MADFFDILTKSFSKDIMAFLILLNQILTHIASDDKNKAIPADITLKGIFIDMAASILLKNCL